MPSMIPSDHPVSTPIWLRIRTSAVANKIVEVRDGEFRVYLGDYHYYLDKLEEERELAKQTAFEAAQAAKKAAKTAKAGGKKK